MRGYADSAWSWWLFVRFETSSICTLDKYNPQRSVYIFQKTIIPNCDNIDSFLLKRIVIEMVVIEQSSPDPDRGCLRPAGPHSAATLALRRHFTLIHHHHLLQELLIPSVCSNPRCQFISVKHSKTVPTYHARNTTPVPFLATHRISLYLTTSVISFPRGHLVMTLPTYHPAPASSHHNR